MQVTFGTAHPLKTLWLQHKIPMVKKGIYGGDLTSDSITIEHLQCRKSGGKTTYSNLALATKENNNRRGDRPLKQFLTQEQADEYLSQFVNVKADDFDGNRYIRRVEPTIKRLLK